MILIDGKTHTLTEVSAWLRAKYGVVTGPVLSSERAAVVTGGSPKDQP
jgi:hypothetical protein